MLTDTLSTAAVTLTCCHAGCGMSFAVPHWWEQQRRDDHTAWYCPNGHRQYFSHESDAEREVRLRKESDAALARERARHDQTKAALEHEQRSARAVRGHLSRTKKRVAAGVCPCCNRTFVNLGRHMSGQHPGFARSES